ncbi:MAG: type II CAAX endopeptidase family protein [bacterium]|nr:type II CAAX endopeptidase family protein [bacterium]MDE0602445.1 type II CAAX endopeptidase family protein [bacterium]
MQDQVAQGRWTIPDLVLIAFAGLVGSLVGVGIGQGSEVTAALIGQFLLTAAALALVGRARQRDYRRLGFVVEGRDAMLVVLGMGLQVGLAVVFFPVARLVGLETDPQVLTGEVAAMGGLYRRMAVFLLIGLIGPVLEELMFRGILIDALGTRFERRGVIFWSAAAFSAFHLTGISTVQPLESAAVLVPQLFLFGVVLAHLRISRGRLGPAIFTHAGFNLLSLLVLVFYPEFV